MTDLKALETAAGKTFDAVVARDESDAGKRRIRHATEDLISLLPRSNSDMNCLRIDEEALGYGSSKIDLLFNDEHNENSEVGVIDLGVDGCGAGGSVSLEANIEDGDAIEMTSYDDESARTIYIAAVVSIARHIDTCNDDEDEGEDDEDEDEDDE